MANQIQNTTVIGLMSLALIGVTQMPLRGSTFQAALQDKDLVAKQNQMIAKIQSDPRYGNEAFTPDKLVERVDLGKHGNFVGSSVSGDPTFWAIHNSRLAATDIRSSQDGTLDITWKLKDNFDYLPAWDNHSRGGLTYWVYNLTASYFSYYFYDVMGASTELDVTTTWTTHTCPNGDVTTDPCPADPPTNDDSE